MSTIQQVEDVLGKIYPKSFRDIAHTGAMDWLEKPTAWIRENRETLLLSDHAFLFDLCWDLEMIPFDQIEEEMNNFIEIYQIYQDYSEEELQSAFKGVVPFAKNGAGDYFLFAGDKTESSVLLFSHDRGEMIIYADHFLDFLYWQLITGIADDAPDKVKSHPAWKRHLIYLSLAQQTFLESCTKEMAADALSRHAQCQVPEEHLPNKPYPIQKKSSWKTLALGESGIITYKYRVLLTQAPPDGLKGLLQINKLLNCGISLSALKEGMANCPFLLCDEVPEGEAMDLQQLSGSYQPYLLFECYVWKNAQA